MNVTEQAIIDAMRAKLYIRFRPNGDKFYVTVSSQTAEWTESDSHLTEGIVVGMSHVTRGESGGSGRTTVGDSTFGAGAGGGGSCGAAPEGFNGAGR